MFKMARKILSPGATASSGGSAAPSSAGDQLKKSSSSKKNPTISTSNDQPGGPQSGAPTKRNNNEELDDFNKLNEDPRLPLTVRQIFKITKSWKAIARTMSKTGTAMFLNLFEQNQELFYLFDRFQHLKGKELHDSMELREHAATVMSTLDQSITLLGDYDNFVDYLYSIGKLHQKVPGFERDHFWKIEQPFMKAIKQTLDERCNETIEQIYLIVIKVIIKTIAEGYDQDNAGSGGSNPKGGPPGSSASGGGGGSGARAGNSDGPTSGFGHLSTTGDGNSNSNGKGQKSSAGGKCPADLAQKVLRQQTSDKQKATSDKLPPLFAAGLLSADCPRRKRKPTPTAKMSPEARQRLKGAMFVLRELLLLLKQSAAAAAAPSVAAPSDAAPRAPTGENPPERGPPHAHHLSEDAKKMLSIALAKASSHLRDEAEIECCSLEPHSGVLFPPSKCQSSSSSSSSSKQEQLNNIEDAVNATLDVAASIRQSNLSSGEPQTPSRRRLGPTAGGRTRQEESLELPTTTADCESSEIEFPPSQSSYHQQHRLNQTPHRNCHSTLHGLGPQPMTNNSQVRVQLEYEQAKRSLVYGPQHDAFSSSTTSAPNPTPTSTEPGVSDFVASSSDMPSDPCEPRHGSQCTVGAPTRTNMPSQMSRSIYRQASNCTTCPAIH